jgi:Ras-related protein Rab-7A
MTIAPTAYRQMKVLILGDSGVGKTSVLNQFVMREFSPNYRATIGADFTSRQMEVGESFLTLQIWDTAGQERFRSLAPSFYRGTEICVFIYDITSEPSFLSIESWYELFRQQCDPIRANFPFLLLGNKLDMTKNRVITIERAAELARSHNFLFFEVSAKSCDNMADAFEAVVRRALEATSVIREDLPVPEEIGGRQNPTPQKCKC